MLSAELRSQPQNRTQRALSMASETQKSRDVVVSAYSKPHLHDLDAYYSQFNPSTRAKATAQDATTSPSPALPSRLSDATPYFEKVDLYKRPTSSPMPPHTPANLEAKRQRHEQLLHQQQQQDRLERQQAKQERKQKQQDYKQMYQNQFNYQIQMDEKEKKTRRQQRSQPIYIPPSANTSSEISIFSTGTSDTLSSQLSAPTNEMYYYASRHPQRERSNYYYQDYSTSSSQQSRLDSLSSTTSGSSSSHKTKVSAEQTRSLSLKTQSTKSMYDLRPWYGAPQSPGLEHQRDYESDETLSQGWDSLMDTLHSPTMASPLDATYWESMSRDDLGTEQIETSLENLTLAPADSKNGKGRYMLVLGANGRTGLEVVRQALGRNYRVTAFVRDDRALVEDASLRKHQNLLIVRGSPTCQNDIDRCVDGQDVIINVIGARPMSGDTTISSHSQVVLNNSMKKHGVRRLIVVTSYGCLGLRNYLISTKRLFSRMFMTGILKDKVLQEDIIQRDSASIDWSIIRPVTLKDGELSERYWVSSDKLPKDNKIKILSRHDLAYYMLEIVNMPREFNTIRSIAGKPKPFKTKPYCPFERRREAQEQVKAKLQKEMEKEQKEKELEREREQSLAAVSSKN
ncbi:hypothetical protein BG015_004613 [Linnemannia schmuckeri]|uniref:NAD(P)-binding domain-containing protein n=1 Tax=Linnemannia schmuckeri TaxID=64567 RepID=A0A9P5S569_9FUNG|nr:hypothetical protein BG015_004613 [Linnemannia schmuckeri]